ncbi:MAG: hypothetical protein HOP22_13255 [Nitrospiraceae bacterium]|nr:hypothetical protein [Nitrospiraceae bacterium]
MQVTSKLTQQEKGALTVFGVGLFAGLLIALAGWFFVHRFDPPREKDLVARTEILRAALQSKSRSLVEADQQSAVDRVVQLGDQLVVIGDGFATAAIIANLPDDKKVRVFGKPSFWQDLHGVPAVWQTKGALGLYFDVAGLRKPEDVDSTAQHSERLLWYALEFIRLGQLTKTNVELILSGCGVELDAKDGSPRWRVKDRCSGLLYVIAPDQLVVVATGVNEQNKLDVKPGQQIAMAQLLQNGEVVYADVYLSDPLARVDNVGKPAPPPDKDKTVAVAGGGGAGLDVAYHSLVNGQAQKVAIWEPYSGVDVPLVESPAYKQLRSTHGGKICRVDSRFDIADVLNNSGRLAPSAKKCCDIADDGVDSPNGHETYRAGKTCAALSSLDKVVVAIGRNEVEPPAPLRSISLASGLPSVNVLKSSDASLFALKVNYPADIMNTSRPPLYLVGAAAAWLPKNWLINSTLDNDFKNARDSLLRAVNLQGDEGNPPVGFAATVRMGAKFAVECLKTASSC